MVASKIPEILIPLRMQRCASVMYHSINSFSRFQGLLPREVFVSDLIDTMVAVVSAVSEETYSIVHSLEDEKQFA